MFIRARVLVLVLQHLYVWKEDCVRSQVKFFKPTYLELFIIVIDTGIINK